MIPPQASAFLNSPSFLYTRLLPGQAALGTQLITVFIFPGSPYSLLSDSRQISLVRETDVLSLLVQFKERAKKGPGAEYGKWLRTGTVTETRPLARSQAGDHL